MFNCATHPIHKSGQSVFRRLMPVVILLASACTDATSAQTLAAPLDLSAYHATFTEDFGRLDVSARGPGTRWIAHTPWNGDFGSARFLDPGADTPFSVSGGILSIDLKRGADGKWTSGLLASADSKGRGFKQAGGYFEIRAQFPTGAGVWPSFWLASGGADADIKPEVDVVEYYGQDNKAYYVNLHIWQNGKDLYHKSAKVALAPDAATRGFHLYGVAVDADYVTFYFDRMPVARLASRPEFMTPMMILTNLAAGGGWPIDAMPDPSVMKIDYIRAYQRNGR